MVTQTEQNVSTTKSLSVANGKARAVDYFLPKTSVFVIQNHSPNCKFNV